MKKKVLFGEDYSCQIPHLLCKIGNGIVHSRFSNGFNIKLSDSLLFIGSNKNGLLPFGIHLREEDTVRAVSSIKYGESVIWNRKESCLEFPKVKISLKKGQPFKNELIILQNENTFETNFERYCLHITNTNMQTGLEVSVLDFMKKVNLVGEQKWLDVESYLILLMAAAKSSDEMLMDKALRYFLGRGQGLTPSGDDLIVGFLAFDAISHFLSNRFYEKLSELIEGESITTDVAREYLRYALKQQYSSTVSIMVNTLAGDQTHTFEEVFQRLLGVGHSSGADTLLGILIGMLTYKSINNKSESNN